MITARYSTVRLEKKLSAALAVGTSGQIEDSYRRDAQGVAEMLGRRIAASGRGGEHNSEFANVEHRVFRAASGRYNIMVGWLNPPAHAREKGGGGKLWYQYQDAGFHLFGGSQWIDGVGAMVDRRERLLEEIETTNRNWLRMVAREMNR